MLTLNILPLSETSRQLYTQHGTFHKGDCGLDLFILEDQVIRAGETALIPLGIKTSAWNSDGNNVGWLLAPRSSIYKTNLRLANSLGIIDAGYRGEVKAAVDNIKKTDFTVYKGDRLFQAIAFTGESFQYTVVDKLDETSRGEGGFGSTNLTGCAIPNASISKIN